MTTEEFNSPHEHAIYNSAYEVGFKEGYKIGMQDAKKIVMEMFNQTNIGETK